MRGGCGFCCRKRRAVTSQTRDTLWFCYPKFDEDAQNQDLTVRGAIHAISHKFVSELDTASERLASRLRLIEDKLGIEASEPMITASSRRSRAVISNEAREKRAKDKLRDMHEELPFQCLRIKILRATGLANADNELLTGKSDSYCTCEILGKHATKISTQVCNDNLNPEWNFEDYIDCFQEGDTLKFVVLDHDLAKQDDLLGKATVKLRGDDLAAGFSSKLALEDAGKGMNATLEVEVHVCPMSPGGQSSRRGQPGEEAEARSTVDEARSEAAVNFSIPSGGCVPASASCTAFEAELLPGSVPDAQLTQIVPSA